MISTYSTLKSAVFNFSGRDDLSESFDTILQLAEQAIYHNEDQPLRTQELITTVTLATVSGSDELALPTDFLGIVSILIKSGGTTYELTNTSVAALGRTGESGVPQKFAITDRLIFDFVSDGAYDISLTYYARPLELDETNNTNVILTKFPSVYLYGCLSAVAELSGEEQDAELNYQKMQRGIRGVVASSRKTRHSSSTTSRTRGSTP